MDTLEQAGRVKQSKRQIKFSGSVVKIRSNPAPVDISKNFYQSSGTGMRRKTVRTFLMPRIRGTKDPAVYKDAVLLSHCSSDQAVNWLQTRDRPKPDYSSDRFPDFSTEWSNREAAEKLLDFILLKRRDTAITAQLAQSSVSELVLSRIHSNGNQAIKNAVLQNPFFAHGRLSNGSSLPWGVIESEDLQALRSYMMNPALSMHFAAAALVSKEPALRADLIGFYLRCLGKNPRYKALASGRASETRFGYDETGWQKLNTALGNLLQLLPVEYETASGLSELLTERSSQTLNGWSFDMIKVPEDDIDATIKRWDVQHDPSTPSWKIGWLHGSPSEQSYGVHMEFLRLSIARAIVAPSRQNYLSDNPYRVAAFFSNFAPEDEFHWHEIESEEFSARLDECQIQFSTKTEIDEGDIDRMMFVRENRWLWASSKGRDFLKRRVRWRTEKYFDQWVENHRLSDPEMFQLVESAESEDRRFATKNTREADERNLMALEERARNDGISSARQIKNQLFWIQTITILTLVAVTITGWLK